MGTEPRRPICRHCKQVIRPCAAVHEFTSGSCHGWVHAFTGAPACGGAGANTATPESWVAREAGHG